MNIYIDIDGTIITKKTKVEAEGLSDLLEYVTTYHDCFWLTTHCKGDASSALWYIKNKVSEKSYHLLKKLHPTIWNTWKTEGIDFATDFLWLDDYAFDKEIRDLQSNNALHKLITINLKEDHRQLVTVLRDLKRNI